MTDHTLGPLPATPFELFHECPGDDDSEGWTEFIDAPGYTADDMRAYALAEVARAVEAERERGRATLRMVADIAHCGGLAGHDTFSALAAIRRLTLPAWNPHGTTDEHRERAKAASYVASRRPACEEHASPRTAQDGATKPAAGATTEGTR